MILDLSNSGFKKIMEDERLHLPIRWDGTDFLDAIENLFNIYTHNLESNVKCNDDYTSIRANLHDIKRVCGLIKRAIAHYLNGFPSKAYRCMKDAMALLMQTPLRIYHKSVFEQFESKRNRYAKDNLNLYRIVCVDENVPHMRSRVFHTPYTLRSKVSTNRYSIAGYPCLYLGTSLALCCEEINYNPHNGFALASKFKIERSFEYNDTNIDVIELAVKPQDFIHTDQNRENSHKAFDELILSEQHVREAYLLWYPLIAVCSYIRANKKDPFAAEYIIPQLLMQWVRSETYTSPDGEYGHLIGIRYFSCASVRASEMGFNYVFPTSGKQHSAKYPYCPVLMKSFLLTHPRYLHEYDNVLDCEWNLQKACDLDYINGSS